MGIAFESHLRKAFIYISSIVFVNRVLPANDFLMANRAPPLCTSVGCFLKGLQGLIFVLSCGCAEATKSKTNTGNHSFRSNNLHIDVNLPQ